MDEPFFIRRRQILGLSTPEGRAAEVFERAQVEQDRRARESLAQLHAKIHHVSRAGIKHPSADKLADSNRASDTSTIPPPWIESWTRETWAPSFMRLHAVDNWQGEPYEDREDDSVPYSRLKVRRRVR